MGREPMPSSPTELIERVAAATGPDREIDGAIALALDFPPSVEKWGTLETPRYTASLDAAIALVERVLPGCEWLVRAPSSKDSSMRPHKAFSSIATSEVYEHAATPTLALLKCLLRALTKGGNGDD